MRAMRKCHRKAYTHAHIHTHTHRRAIVDFTIKNYLQNVEKVKKQLIINKQNVYETTN